MTVRILCALGALLWAGQGIAQAGEPDRIQLKWSELGPRVDGRKVALVLPGGTHVEGKVRGVEPEGLRLRVSKTSDRDAMPKGTQLIPRQSVSVLRVTEYRKRGRILGTLAAAGTAAAIAAATYPDLYEGTVIIVVPAVVAGGITGAAIGGYYIGKAADKRVTEILVRD